MKQDGVVARLDAARTALAEAKTLSETKSILDAAAAAEVYARRQKLSQEAIDYAHEIKTYALCKLGEMLRNTDRARGTVLAGRDSFGCANAEQPKDDAPTLADLGIDRKTSATAQKMAALAPEQQAAIAKQETSITKALRAEKAAEIAREVSLPNAKYRVIYADPPWSYGNNQPDYQTEQRDHYPVMQLRDICALPVAQLCEENAVLFLWVTSPILEESFDVVRAWGFRYKATFVWDKVKHNMGHYNSVRHEFLLICTRGSGVPEVPRLFDSVVTQERSAHSAKPEVFYEIIETLYPSGRKLEMFARSERRGWDGYGHQAASIAA